MTFTLLAVVGIGITLTAVFALGAKTTPSEALASEATAVGLHDPATETLGTDNAGSLPRPEWQVTTVDSLSDAEALLDMLENQGQKERELVILGDSRFAVRWR